MIYNFNWIIFLPPPPLFLFSEHKGGLCARSCVMIGLVSCEDWWPRTNGCTAEGTSVFVWSERITVADLGSAQYHSLKNYVYSVLNGVKLCKPRSTLDSLFISIVYTELSKSWAACCWWYWLAHCRVKNTFPPLLTAHRSACFSSFFFFFLNLSIFSCHAWTLGDI